MTQDDKIVLTAEIDKRREATKHQASWYNVRYDEYWKLLDLLEHIISVS